MKKNLGTIIIGLLFIIAGVGYSGNIIGLWEGFTILFPGWWSLFIIMPCFVSLFKYGYNSGSFIGLMVGLFFLVSSQEKFSFLWKLILPIILIIIGCVIIFNLIFVNSNIKKLQKTKNRFGIPYYSGIFATQRIKINSDEIFNGAEITAIFGSVEIDLSEAQFSESEVLINITNLFSGIDILVPHDAIVKIVNTPIVGTVNNKAATSSDIVNAPVINIRCLNIFSGIDILQDIKP